MSIIKPFKGFRPPVDIVEKLASRPYDVLNSEEARVECEGNPYSLLHVTKAEIDLPKGRTTTCSKTSAGWSRMRRRNSTSMPRA